MSDDPGDISDKAALRILARQRRRAFVAELDPLAHRLAFKALPSPLARRLEGTRTVALYRGIEDEAPAQRLATKLVEMGKTIALPRVIDRMGSMEFLPWHPDAPLLPGPFGTSHPEQGNGPVTPDAIIAPLLGFDRAMNRLGQGGGYYDRAFARHPHALRIGLAWSAQEQDAIPADPWDLPLHMVLTEVELIEGNEP
ncbi:5-formyltetrahydrofolate cyclo-ligase [Sphingobium faniae]|nr:5-formyltetrahydrofolate cyclo-ligase [Sphingobium faniae]